MKRRPKLESISEEMKAWSGSLAQELSSWRGVTSRPMFSMMAFYRKGKIFALLPRTKAFETSNSIAFKLYRQTPKTSKLLLSDPRIRVHRDKHASWIGFELGNTNDLRDALKWFDLAYQDCGSGAKSRR